MFRVSSNVASEKMQKRIPKNFLPNYLSWILILSTWLSSLIIKVYAALNITNEHNALRHSQYGNHSSGIIIVICQKSVNNQHKKNNLKKLKSGTKCCVLI